MKWEPVALAKFARDGGFDATQIPTAVAIAMATSNGISNYEARAGVAGAGHWQGLWGIDTDLHDQYADWDLHVPQHAARAARELTEAHDGFSWSPAYNAGHHRHHVARAGTARTQENDGQRPGLPITVHETDRSLERAYARLSLLRTQLRPIETRWPVWPSITR